MTGFALPSPCLNTSQLALRWPGVAWLDAQSPMDINRAAQAVSDGQLLAFPTETVYGLGARADDDGAVAKIYAAKGRPSDHPLIVHVQGIESAQHFVADWPEQAQRLAQEFWPGPLTLVLPRRAGVAAAAAGGHGTVALRCPSHPVAQTLMRAASALGVAGIAAPSANRFGQVSPTWPEHVAAEFPEVQPPLPVLAGLGCECAVGIESTIVDCTQSVARILRPGGLTATQLRAVCPDITGVDDAPSTEAAVKPRVSGDLPSHYAPRAILRLWAHEELIAALQHPMPYGPVALYAQADVCDWAQAHCPAFAEVTHQRMPHQPQAVAHELFAVLRHLDEHLPRNGQLWVQMPWQQASAAEQDAWQGVKDRLQRAAAPR